jgi:hypothetical protein
MFAIMHALIWIVTPLDLLMLLDRVFAVRLVLTGPAPCELVDAKICLTFRIFVKLPSGSMFCSTQDLELVRPEVFISRFEIGQGVVVGQISLFMSFHCNLPMIR